MRFVTATRVSHGSQFKISDFFLPLQGEGHLWVNVQCFNARQESLETKKAKRHIL
jgi:hypothetical protein